MGGQSWTKRANFGSVTFSLKFESFKFFQTMLLFLRVLPLVRISTILGYILGRKGPNPPKKNSPKKSHFMNAESTCRTRIFNLTITNAILIRLPMIMYLHENVNRKHLRARNSVFWSNVYEFLDCIKNCHICHILPFIALQVKRLYKFHEKPLKIGPK